MKTINPSIWTYQDPATWLSFVNGLRIARPTKAAKSVPDISISFTKKTTIVRLARDKKQVSQKEVELLSQEYFKTVEELTALFTSRKIQILNDKGEVMNAPEPKPRISRKRKAKEAPEEDASGCPGPEYKPDNR